MKTFVKKITESGLYKMKHFGVCYAVKYESIQTRGTSNVGTGILLRSSLVNLLIHFFKNVRHHKKDVVLVLVYIKAVNSHHLEPETGKDLAALTVLSHSLLSFS